MNNINAVKSKSKLLWAAVLHAAQNNGRFSCHECEEIYARAGKSITGKTPSNTISSIIRYSEPEIFQVKNSIAVLLEYSPENKEAIMEKAKEELDKLNVISQKPTKNYKYKFPIGDWSGDGHGKCEYYMVNGAKPIEDVRNAHFECNKILGFDIGDLCSDYEEYEIDDLYQTILTDYGIVEASFFKRTEDQEADMCDLWLKILNYIDPELKLRRCEEDEIPSITFYGYDEHGRHLNNPGYGLF